MLEQLRETLEATGFSWAHHGWSKAPAGDYGVYFEGQGDDLGVDNIHGETGTTAYVNLFTRDDSTAPRRKVEAALNGLKMPWLLNSVQFEEDTGYIHFEWQVGLLGEL